MCSMQNRLSKAKVAYRKSGHSNWGLRSLAQNQGTHIGTLFQKAGLVDAVVSEDVVKETGQQ